MTPGILSQSVLSFINSLRQIRFLNSFGALQLGYESTVRVP